ncbi:hypothetical protein DCAR_0104091 [Daucus carota subsp. sativus]|uniref:Arf-GAP domain-containing protein n=1 Tax=Daucus carota subsp. sativus TaxID=79200 RepID=A0AAF0W8R1_DAUCS|nr:hypothetical protein DCAR_0104091 [Daucus carota subsp. sativus]
MVRLYMNLYVVQLFLISKLTFIYLRVLSVTLDEWSDEDIDHVVECGGNAFANSIYEAYFPAGVSKPGPSASNEERSKFIKLDG